MDLITFDRLSAHISRFSLIVLAFICYFSVGDELSFINGFLPSKGKPLFVFTLLSIVLMYELVRYRAKFVDSKIDEILYEISANRVKGAVGALYATFMESGDEYIDNEFTIKELNELSAQREKLGVNSYTQGKLKFLESKVRRGKPH